MSARLTVEERQLRGITEAEWQRQVTDLASLRGWTWWHAPDNRPIVARSGKRYVQPVRPGFPDLLLVRRERLVFAELKRETGVLTSDQAVWLAALEAAGAETHVWRPSDLAQVQEVLA